MTATRLRHLCDVLPASRPSSSQTSPSATMGLRFMLAKLRDSSTGLMGLNARHTSRLSLSESASSPSSSTSSVG